MNKWCRGKEQMPKDVNKDETPFVSLAKVQKLENVLY
jgi:hypothetical protein